MKKSEKEISTNLVQKLVKEYYGINRTTFIIDEDGVIEDIIIKVKTKEHTAQILI